MHHPIVQLKEDIFSSVNKLSSDFPSHSGPYAGGSTEPPIFVVSN